MALAPNIPAFRVADGDVTFILGQNSNMEPSQLAGGMYSRSMNTVNRGGIIQCRPGYRCRMALPDGNLQGGAFFVPKQGLPVFLFGVEGLLYSSEYPYKTFRQVENVSFAPQARQLYFKQVEQSIRLNEDGSLTLIDPRVLMVIQDGAYSPPVVYDGTRAEHQRGATAIPLGGAMEWVGDRLWVSRDADVFPSDLQNPVAFTEHLFIPTVKVFKMPGEVTAMSKSTNFDFPQLLIFTGDTTTVLQASLRDRSQWVTTVNFQYDLFKKIGATSQRSVIAHHGLLWWFSNYGLTSLDSAVQANSSSTLPYRDSEMADSKGLLSDDLSGVASASVENYLLVSVPYADRYNKHTWCLDNTTIQTLNEAAPPAWNSVWTGTRPVEWYSMELNGTSQVFYTSKDFDGRNRLWEAFTPDRLDDGCPITWYAELRGYTLQDPLRGKQFRFADVFLSELEGVFDIAVFWAGSQRGKYKRILTKRVQSNVGTLRYEDELTADSTLFALKKQSRRLRTQDAREILEGETHDSCDVESPQSEYLDEAFQLLIVGSGPGAIRQVKLFMDPKEGENLSGSCEEDETEVNAVRYDGAAEEGEDFEGVVTTLSLDESVFTAVRAETVTVDGITTLGVGQAESVISQADADKIATDIARRKASKELEGLLPKMAS